jgi:hypothetical protein
VVTEAGPEPLAKETVLDKGEAAAYAPDSPGIDGLSVDHVDISSDDRP